MKKRIIQWIEFNVLADCGRCPLFNECAYGWRQGTKRTATNCKLWRRLDVEPPHDK